MGNMRAVLRVVILGFVVLVMTGSAYLAGFGTSWLMTRQMGLADAAQAVSRPDDASAAGRLQAVDFDIFWEGWDIVDREFYGAIPNQDAVAYGAIQGALQTLGDPNTLFIDPQTAELNRPELEGEFDGIGAVVTMDADGQLIVISPMEGQPAMEAGLQAGDIILEVDGKEIAGLNLTEAVLLIRGPRGTSVHLKVLRLDTEGFLEYDIVRSTIETLTVSHRMLEEAPEIGYLRLNMFGPNSVEELRDAIRTLQDQGAKGYIFDERP